VAYNWRVGSNAQWWSHRVNSNAIAFANRTLSTAVSFMNRTHSNAIKWIDTQLRAIDNGPLDVDVNSSVTLTYDYHLSSDHILNVNAAATIDGGGLAMYFANGDTNVIKVAAGITLTLKNIVLKDFADDTIQLGTGAAVIFGDGTTIELAKKQSLSRSWTFHGTATINGYGNKLALGDYTIGVVSPGTLTIQDVILDGLKSNNVRCVGDNAKIVFRSSDLLMSHNLSVTAGQLRFEQDVRMTGTNQFTLASNKAATVANMSRLLLDTGVQFKYSPSSNNRDLLVMEDMTSLLHMNGCVLTTTTTGLRLTKGTLLVDHKNTLVNDGATALTQGFAFGNGIAASDLTVEMMPGATLGLQSGLISYENVN